MLCLVVLCCLLACCVVWCSWFTIRCINSAVSLSFPLFYVVLLVWCGDLPDTLLVGFVCMGCLHFVCYFGVYWLFCLLIFALLHDWWWFTLLFDYIRLFFLLELVFAVLALLLVLVVSVGLFCGLELWIWIYGLWLCLVLLVLFKVLTLDLVLFAFCLGCLKFVGLLCWLLFVLWFVCWFGICLWVLLMVATTVTITG